MTARETIAGVQAFLDSYGAAFDRYDADAVAAHFLLPGHVTVDNPQVALVAMTDIAQCRAGTERVLALHREIGAAASRTIQFRVSALSPRLAVLDLRSEFVDGEGRALYDFEGFYTLAKTPDGWRIAAIAHNQMPRLLAARDQSRGRMTIASGAQESTTASPAR